MREFFDATEAAVELQRLTKLEWTAAQVLREAENGNLPICFQHQGKIGVFNPEESELGQSIFGKALRTTYLPRGSYLRVQGHPLLTNVNKKQVSLCPRNLELVKAARGASEVSVTASETLRIVSESGGFKDTAAAVLQVPSIAWLFHADDLGNFAGTLPLVIERTINAPGAVPFKKFVLIAAHIHEWPSIKRDIADANKNGLAATAKAGARGWWEDAALTWARANGKLTSVAKPAENLAEAMHNLAKLPSRKHTMRS